MLLERKVFTLFSRAIYKYAEIILKKQRSKIKEQCIVGQEKETSNGGREMLGVI
jgi:hypothetical protein